MTRIINLRQARKSRTRDDNRATGDANAARFGEAKPAREARQAEDARAARIHEAHRRDVPPQDAPRKDARPELAPSEND